jgi:dipeptidyl aminopeptidase/acylaminoacyl peptidase
MKSAQRDQGYWLRLARLALVALAVGIAGGLVGYSLLASALYTHALTHPGCGDMGGHPSDVGIEGAQAVTYTSHDGLPLQAWYASPQNGAVVILLPGWGGARDGMLLEAGILARHGYGLLMTEMRSCPHPSGLTTMGHYEALDLVEAVTWVLDQPDADHVGALGYSLGGVVALLGAARDDRIEATVAEGGFYDLTADITDQDRDIPPLKRLMYLTNPLFFRRTTGVSTRSISPISVIHQIAPQSVLLIYGEHEVGPGHALEQYEAAGQPKDLWIVPNCGHGGYIHAAPDEWEQRIVTFFDRALLSETSAEE